MKTLEKLFIPKNLPIDKIINHMNDNSNYDLPKGILLVVDSNNYLLGTITDGDIRRVYRKENQKIVANEIMNNKPLTFLDDTPYETIIMEIPKRLKNRKDTSRKFLSNIILVDKNNIPMRIVNYHELWQNKIVDYKKISILGLGYVGITLSLALADTDLIIFGYDIDTEKVKRLNKGYIDVHELGINRLLNEHLNKNFFASDSLSEDSDVYIICVSTPIEIDQDSKSFYPTLKFIEKSLEEIGKKIKKDDLIILRSTVPIGSTRDHFIPIIEKISGLKCGLDFKISFAPERTVEGKAMEELRELPQIIGGYDEKSIDETAKLFSRLTSTVVRVDSIESAEMVKLINNSYRDYVFAYANKLSMMAQDNNLDINHIIKSANKGYPRNPIPLPSPGVGGPCLTKDPYIFSSTLSNNDDKDENNIFLTSRRINEKMHSYVVERIINQILHQGKNLDSVKILICGLAFKGQPETGDIRNSSPLEIYKLIQDKNIDVYGYDHVIDKNILIAHGIRYHNLNDNINGFDVIMFLNNHKMNEKMNIFDLIRQMNQSPIFFDGWSQFQKTEIMKVRECTYMNLSVTTSSVGK